MLKPPWGPNVWMKTKKNTKTHSNESTLWLLKRTILRFPIQNKTIWHDLINWELLMLMILKMSLMLKGNSDCDGGHNMVWSGFVCWCIIDIQTFSDTGQDKGLRRMKMRIKAHCASLKTRQLKMEVSLEIIEFLWIIWDVLIYSSCSFFW